jgi:hypothetical protein
MTRVRLIFFAAYLVSLVAAIAALMHARSVRLADWNQSETHARWHEFQAAERKQWEDQTGPVRRRPAGGDAPADVILLRDHFGAVAGGIVTTGTFLFVFLALLLRGCLTAKMPKEGFEPSSATP